LELLADWHEIFSNVTSVHYAVNALRVFLLRPQPANQLVKANIVEINNKSAAVS